jgi:hypothetical protein
LDIRNAFLLKLKVTIEDNEYNEMFLNVEWLKEILEKIRK